MHPPLTADRSLVKEPRRHRRRRLDQLLRGLHEAHHDRQRALEHELALHDPRDGAKLFPDHSLPVLIVARDDERCLIRLALRHHLRFPAGAALEVEPDAHRLADPYLRLTIHHEGDRTVRPLERGGTIRVARVDRQAVGAHPFGRRECDAHAIASAKPRNNAFSTSSSGCHWTASAHGARGSFRSAPSITPSSAQAFARSAGATSRIAWWCRVFTLASTASSVRWSSVPASMRSAWRERVSAWSTGPGRSLARSWYNVPPRATFRTWMPRQMARTGRRRRSAPATRASSTASRARSVSPSLGCGVAP